MFVCYFLDDISKTAAVRIAELDTETLHHGSWKLISFWVKRFKVKVTLLKKNIAGVGFCSLDDDDDDK